MSVILSEVKGFTPVIDVVAKELGFITAGVYGLVWRHCQMNNHICRASVETLAGMLEVSPNTIRRHLKKLVDYGYIIDTTPDRTNAPHVYKDSGKVKIQGLLEAKEDTHKGQAKKKDTQREQPPTQKEQASLPTEGREETILDSIKDTTGEKTSPNGGQSKNKVREALEIKFSNVTGLQRPKTNTQTQRKSAGSLWWNPLREIAELCDWNTDRSTKLIGETVKHLKSNKMTIASPKSILNSARANVANSGVKYNADGRMVFKIGSRG